jgi:hypothetical protein
MDEASSNARSALSEQFHTPYTVELMYWPQLPAADRATIESRFARELEKRFGSAEGVKVAFFASYMQREEHAETSGPDTDPITTEWDVAAAAARAASFDGFEPPPSARLWLSFYDEVYERPE